MSTLHNNRWVAADDEFAVRIEVPDVPGFFSKSVIVEPGFRALFLEDGESLGELPSGQHTLANVVDRMKFWTKKTATVIVARQQDVRLELTCPGLPTSELLEVEITLALTVQVDDVAMFFSNLMGAKSSIAINDIRHIVEPLLCQSLGEAVGRLSINELVAEHKRADIETGVAQALRTSLMRYGLKFGTVQTLTIAHPEYDAQRRRTGQLWLQRQELDFDTQSARLEADKLFAQIERQEKADDLDILQQQVTADHMEADLAVRMRRIEIRKQLRAAALAGRFDRLNNEEELQKFLEQRDRERLIRQDEIDSLTVALREQATDRDAARKHLLSRLDLEQSAELESVRIDLDHQQRLKTCEYEIALTEQTQSAENRQWKAALQKEAEGAEHRRAQAQAELQAELARKRDTATVRRAEEQEESAHSLRNVRIENEVKVESAIALQRIAAIEVETQTAREQAELELKRRKTELIDEGNRKAGEDQIKRLQLVTEINLATQRAQHQMVLEAEQKRAEIEVMKSDAAARASVTKMTGLRGASAFEVMAAAPDVAGQIANVMNTQASANASIATSNAQTAADRDAAERERELQSQLVSAKDEGMQAAIAAYRESLQSQQAASQAAMQQFGTTIENVTKNIAPTNPHVFFTGGSTVGPVAPPSSVGSAGTSHRVVLCPHCRSENEETDHHCCRCGKGL